MHSKLILISALAAFFSISASGQGLTLSEAERIIPREIKKPVKSLIPSEQKVGADTLSTSNEEIKIVLFKDGTWKYWKDPEITKTKDVFTSHWDQNSSDPYHLEWADFPYKSYIWMVDSTSRYCYPLDMKYNEISSKFGFRKGRYHRGIDIRVPKGEPLYAAFSGKVRMAKYISGYGNVVVIRHENGFETFYGHMSKIETKPDDWVEAGQEIGLAGATGRASGPHLHWEVRYLGYAIDPEWVIDFATGELRSSVLTFKKQYLDPNYKYAATDDSEEEEIALADEADRLEAERLEAEMKAAKYVKVKKGDTLSRIAINNGTTVSALCKLNGITAKTTLSIGRSLRVK